MALGIAKSLCVWIMTNLDPGRALQIYQVRMKTEETFRDCKNLLRLPKVMNKLQKNLEKMITYPDRLCGCLLEGEVIRDDTLVLILRSAIPFFASLVYRNVRSFV